MLTFSAKFRGFPTPKSHLKTFFPQHQTKPLRPRTQDFKSRPWLSTDNLAQMDSQPLGVLRGESTSTVSVWLLPRVGAPLRVTCNRWLPGPLKNLNQLGAEDFRQTVAIAKLGNCRVLKAISRFSYPLERPGEKKTACNNLQALGNHRLESLQYR